MILSEAIEFSKQFPSCHPKIFKEFAEWRSCNTRTDGYVILTTLAKEIFSTKMDDYIKSQKLQVDQIKDYWMISSPI